MIYLIPYHILTLLLQTFNSLNVLVETFQTLTKADKEQNNIDEKEKQERENSKAFVCAPKKNMEISATTRKGCFHIESKLQGFDSSAELFQNKHLYIATLNISVYIISQIHVAMFGKTQKSKGLMHGQPVRRISILRLAQVNIKILLMDFMHFTPCW